MYSAACHAYKGPKVCTHILGTQAIAVDAFSIGRELEKASYYLLVPLFFSPATHASRFGFPQQFLGEIDGKKPRVLGMDFEFFERGMKREARSSSLPLSLRLQISTLIFI